MKISAQIYEEAKKYMPGGVNNPVRAYCSVDMTPPFMERGAGSKVYDVEGNEYIDYVASGGSLILGHAPEEVIKAVKNAAVQGTSFGAPTEGEIRLARLVVEAVPSVEMVRFVNSGTEAVMSALRLARACTGKKKILKFAGCYHGHADSMLIKAGSGVATLGLPDSPGVTPGTAGDTITAAYNDISQLEEIFSCHTNKGIACVIVEPVAGNMGVIPPEPGFLETIRRLTIENGTLLIFDEVMSGFRVAFGGAQELYGITPDLTCLGKIIGGGMPTALYGGQKELMEQVAPSGPVYQAGTLSGNPLAMAAGIETLSALQQPGIYKKLEAKAALLEMGLFEAAGKSGVEVSINRVGSMFSIFFTSGKVTDLAAAQTTNQNQFKVFFRAMLHEGIYIAPSPFETLFLSLAHSEKDIEHTVTAAHRGFKEAANIK